MYFSNQFWADFMYFSNFFEARGKFFPPEIQIKPYLCHKITTDYVRPLQPRLHSFPFSQRPPR